MKDKAALAALGIEPCSSNSSDSADDHVPGITLLSPEVMSLRMLSLVESKCNWFTLMDVLENHAQVDDTFAKSHEVFLALSSSGFTPDRSVLLDKQR